MPTMKQLLDQYNLLAANVGKPKVTRFASRHDGEKRLADLLKKSYPDDVDGPTPDEADHPQGPPEGDLPDNEAPADAPADEEQVLGRADPRPTRSQMAVDRLVAKLRSEGADVQIIVIKGVNVPVNRRARRPTRARAQAATGRPSMAQRAEEMLLNGATNEELWEVFRTEYGLDDTKRSYPGWYRNSLKRQGKLPVDN